MVVGSLKVVQLQVKFEHRVIFLVYDGVYGDKD